MKLEETIQAMFDSAPSIFQTREDTLNHLFITLGNGYEWVNGELIDEDSEDEEVILKGGGVAIQTIKDDSMKLIKEVLGYDNNKPYLYPLSNSCNLFSYPEDIKDDWLGGIKEAVIMLLKYRNEDVERMNQWQRSEHDKASIALNKLANSLGII